MEEDLLTAAVRGLRRGAVEGMREYGVTPAQARALRVLAKHGDARPSLIAEHLRIAPRSATELVDALEERGLVAREPDPTDRRAVVVSLTSRGRAVNSEVAALRDARHREFLAVLSDRERRDLAQILRRLVDPEA